MEISFNINIPVNTLNTHTYDTFNQVQMNQPGSVTVNDFILNIK